jgi:hypothetical protein
MAPFNLKKAVAATQRRKGAKTQGFRFLGSFTRWESDSSPSFPSRLPALCVLASLRLCVNCLSWDEPGNPYRRRFTESQARLPGNQRLEFN